MKRELPTKYLYRSVIFLILWFAVDGFAFNEYSEIKREGIIKSLTQLSEDQMSFVFIGLPISITLLALSIYYLYLYGKSKKNSSG